MDQLVIGNQRIAAEQLLPLLASYQMLPQLKQELIIDRAIASITCTEEEQSQAQQHFFQTQQIKSEAELQLWLDHYGLDQRQLPSLIDRPLRIEKFKQLTWGAKLESHFLTRKPQFDQALYSLLRVSDLDTAQELYFRLHTGEQSFAEIAREYSQGPEAQTGGLVGPFDISTLQPDLAQILATSQPGQINPPAHLNDWFVIIRLEKFLAAQLDDRMRQRLLNDLFQEWLKQQLKLQAQLPSAPPLTLAVPS